MVNVLQLAKIKLIIIPKIMDYWLVASNRCSTTCPSTDVSLCACWLGGPCVMTTGSLGNGIHLPHPWALVPTVLQTHVDVK